MSGKLLQVHIIGTVYYVKKFPPNYDKRYRESNAYYHHGLKSNVDCTAMWADRLHTIKTNSLGFKDMSTRKVPLNTEKLRILFVGDSFTEGVGYSYEETFVGILASMVDTTRIEILNAACVSYSPKLYYLKVKYLVENLNLKIDHLIILNDISDIQDEVSYDSFITGYKAPKPSFIEKLYTYAKKHSATGILLTKYIIAPPKIGEWKHGDYWRERGLWIDDAKVQNAWGMQGMRLAESNLQLLVDFCFKHDIKMKIVIYPWPDQIRKGELTDKYVDLWSAFSKRNGIEMINFYNYLLNNTPAEEIVNRYFIENDAHLNNHGHVFFAEKLKVFIDKLIITN